MLTPKQLLAETAKFFSLHPERFLRHSLSSRPIDVADPNRDCFCTVGYMAARLRQEGLNVTDPYRAVGKFFDGEFGESAVELYSSNDQSDTASEAVETLKEKIARVN